MNAYDIILRPVITEQSMESVADKKYVFMVDVNADKTQIKAAIEEAFGVKVAKVKHRPYAGQGEAHRRLSRRQQAAATRRLSSP